MESFILQHLIITGALYLLYIALFSRTSFFRLNRLVLLTIPVMSVAIPLLAPLFERPETLTALPVVQLPELLLTAETTGAEAGTSFNWLLYLYIAGAAVMLIVFSAGLFRCYRLIVRARYLYENIYSSQKAQGPFAFIDKIVIPENLLESEKLEDIISHEKAHVQQGHSYDKLFYNLYTLLFWFNPFAHLLSRELLTVHECLADEVALQNSSAENYAHLLLSSAMGSEINLTGATPFFNSSLIKTRITMIYKAKTKTAFKALYLFLIPIVVFFAAVACEKNDTNTTKTLDQKNADQAEIEKLIDSIDPALKITEVDQPPLFNDCKANASKEEQLNCFHQGLMKYVIQNFKYPELAREEKLEGKIYMGFLITNEGNVASVDVRKVQWEFNGHEVVPSEDTKLNTLVYCKELIRAIPQMAPAIKDGKPVTIQFVLPIRLKLD